MTLDFAASPPPSRSSRSPLPPPTRLLGGLFVIITLSVLIQVGSYKLTGKRVFKMAPLQHHFELSGWAETTIVVRFWPLAGMFVLVGLWVLYRSGAAGLR